MKPQESFKRIVRLLKSWEAEIRDQERIEDIRTALMEAKTCKEVNEIAISNLNYIDRMGMWKHVNHAKRRINNLKATKIKLTDLKYLN